MDVSLVIYVYTRLSFLGLKWIKVARNTAEYSDIYIYIYAYLYTCIYCPIYKLMFCKKLTCFIYYQQFVLNRLQNLECVRAQYSFLNASVAFQQQKRLRF